MAHWEQPNGGRPKAVLLYLVTEDWYFWSHRLPVARAARDAGFDVVVATRVRAHGERIASEGFRLRPLSWSRDSISPLTQIRVLSELVGLYRAERPAIVHHVALKAVVYGSIAARLAGVRHVINAVTGLGFAFTERSISARLARFVLQLLFRAAVDRTDTLMIFQNEDDRALLYGDGFLKRSAQVTIRGSGVDLHHFASLPEPALQPPTIAVVTRMLASKGVETAVAASRLLRSQGTRHRLLLVGAPDPTNPASIPEQKLREWADEPGIEWLGHVDDVREVWKEAHIAALLSLREGLPKALLEAAACGRPIVAADVPGSREVVRHQVNGLLVPANDAAAAAAAMARLIANPDLRIRFGQEGRRFIERELSSSAVASATLAQYRAAVDPSDPAINADRFAASNRDFA